MLYSSNQNNTVSQPYFSKKKKKEKKFFKTLRLCMESWKPWRELGGNRENTWWERQAWGGDHGLHCQRSLGPGDQLSSDTWKHNPFLERCLSEPSGQHSWTGSKIRLKWTECSVYPKGGNPIWDEWPGCYQTLVAGPWASGAGNTFLLNFGVRLASLRRKGGSPCLTGNARQFRTVPQLPVCVLLLNWKITLVTRDRYDDSHLFVCALSF